MRARALGAWLGLAVFVAVPLAARAARAAEPTVIAVAANFAEAAEALAVLYADAGQAGDGRPAPKLAFGSTGALFAQIATGAPFAALLAADVATPARLEAEGRAVAGSRFVYAIGRLALWSADEARIGTDGLDALRDPALRHLAIANPDLAPYGAAARQALRRLGLWDALTARIVMGQNVGHTLSLVASGAAEMGFVARAAIAGPGRAERGSRWDVPRELHDPIRQAAVLLEPGRDDPVARGFLAFLQSETAREVIRRYGYEVQ